MTNWEHANYSISILIQRNPYPVSRIQYTIVMHLITSRRSIYWQGLFHTQSDADIFIAWLRKLDLFLTSDHPIACKNPTTCNSNNYVQPIHRGWNSAKKDALIKQWFTLIHLFQEWIHAISRNIRDRQISSQDICCLRTKNYLSQIIASIACITIWLCYIA